MSAPQRRVLRMPPHCIPGPKTVPCTPSKSCDECALTTYSFMPGPCHNDNSHFPGRSQGQRFHLQAWSIASCGCTHACGRLDCCLINWPKESLAGPEKSTIESGQGQEGQVDAQLVLSAEGVCRGQKKPTFALGFHRLLPAFAKALRGAPKKSKMNKNKNSFHCQHLLVTSINMPRYSL